MYIYKITNNLNNKIYVGLKTSSVEESESYYGSGVLINKAIDKYGIDNFTKTILERDITDYDLLFDREQYWIEYYDAQENGYNMTAGGKGLINPSPEIRAKWSANRKGKAIHTEESKRKISEASRGRKYVMTEEHRKKLAKLAQTRKGKAIYYNSKNPSEQKYFKIDEQPDGWIRGMGIKRSDEYRAKQRVAMLKKHKEGKIPYKENAKKVAKKLKGKPLSEEHKQSIRKTLTGTTRSITLTTKTCPHCNMSGRSSNMTRYHFDNCKHKNC